MSLENAHSNGPGEFKIIIQEYKQNQDKRAS